MKTNITIAAIAATAIFIFSSCDWFSPGKNVKLNITGKWKIDSVNYSKVKDSSKNGLALLFILSDTSLKKSNYEFTDSGKLFIRIKDSIDETLAYRFSPDKLIVNFGNDSTKDQFSVTDLTKESFSILGNDQDSVRFFFTRTK